LLRRGSTRAHNEFNRSIAGFGVGADREMAYAEKVIARLERLLPPRMRLGATVFFEHLTATGAHMLFTQPALAEAIHPEMLRFWRWHAVEELEHKAVAFDLFRVIGGGYFLRVFSALTALALIAVPFYRIFFRMLREDPHPVTPEMRRNARALQAKLAGPQLRMLAQYFKPDFHPRDCDDEPYLRAWCAAPEGAWTANE
jgi:predicted metal-dependent hydrolase